MSSAIKTKSYPKGWLFCFYIEDIELEAAEWVRKFHA
jgi:hypothetical protein